MTTTCPNGHESEWPDWCSICGERLGETPASSSASSPPGAPAATSAPAPSSSAASTSAPVPGSSAGGAAAAPSGPTCDNCGESRHDDDVFCESCGYDFASGSLPEQVPAETATDMAAMSLHVKVSIDADFFAATTGDVELELPDPLPATQVVPLAGIRILIGRRSTSRGIFPEIDARALTGDPAVSSRHAMLERGADGSWTFTDLGSTNGSFLHASADQAVEPGTALPIAPGATIYVGAWTRIDLVATGAGGGT